MIIKKLILIIKIKLIIKIEILIKKLIIKINQLLKGASGSVERGPNLGPELLHGNVQHFVLSRVYPVRLEPVHCLQQQLPSGK